MKISLLYSTGAGDGVSADDLRAEFERAGHELVHVFEDDSDFERLIDEPTELVVAAGGDGTVWRAASALTGHDIPLAVLPLGTANNVARSLGITGSVREIVGRWTGARRVPLDLGVAHGAWGERGFVEAIGSGLVPSGIAAVEKQQRLDDEASSDEKLAHAVRTYRDVLSRLRPRRWDVTLDGKAMEGEYLLLEVLNISSVGPNLVLSPGADVSDGLLDVAVAGEAQRARIDGYLADRLAGREARLELPVTRARSVEIAGWDAMHVDDEVIDGPPIGKVTIGVVPGAVELLC